MFAPLLLDLGTSELRTVIDARGPVGFTPDGSTIVSCRYTDPVEGEEPPARNLLLIDVETLDEEVETIPLEGLPHYSVTREGNYVVVSSVLGEGVKQLMPAQVSTFYEQLQPVAHVDVTLKDQRAPQRIELPAVTAEQAKPYPAWAVFVEIRSVYRGSRWRDSCIAEIGAALKPGPWREAALVPRRPEAQSFVSVRGPVPEARRGAQQARAVAVRAAAVDPPRGARRVEPRAAVGGRAGVVTRSATLPAMSQRPWAVLPAGIGQIAAELPWPQPEPEASAP